MHFLREQKGALGGLLGLLLTAVFVALLIYNLDWHALLDALRSANYVLVIPAMVVNLNTYFLRTVRWRAILEPRVRLSLRRLFPVLMIGFAANNVLPARVGEVIRAYVLGRKEHLSKAMALGTVVLERVADGVTIVILLAAFSLVWPLPAWGRNLQVGTSVAFVGMLVGLFTLALPGSPTLDFLEHLVGALPASLADRLLELLRSFVNGLESLHGRRALPKVLALSLLLWVNEIFSYTFLTFAFDMPFSGLERIGAGLFVLIVGNLGILLPTTPGYVGAFHFFVVTALTVFGVPKETALSYALVSHAAQYVMVTSLGLAFAWREGLSLWGIEQEAEAIEEDIDVEGAELEIEGSP